MKWSQKIAMWIWTLGQLRTYPMDNYICSNWKDHTGRMKGSLVSLNQRKSRISLLLPPKRLNFLEQFSWALSIHAHAHKERRKYMKVVKPKSRLAGSKIRRLCFMHNGLFGAFVIGESLWSTQGLLASWIRLTFQEMDDSTTDNLFWKIAQSKGIVNMRRFR